MHEFITSAEDALTDEVDKGGTFLLDGHELRYYRPTDGQYAVYMAETAGRRATDSERTAGTINFFIDLFDADSRVYLVNRLLDREDPFGIRKIEEILHAMAEEWGGRPTKPSTGSTRSRRSGGRKSTQPTPALTSSGSQPADS